MLVYICLPTTCGRFILPFVQNFNFIFAFLFNNVSFVCSLVFSLFCTGPFYVVSCCSQRCLRPVATVTLTLALVINLAFVCVDHAMTVIILCAPANTPQAYEQSHNPIIHNADAKLCDVCANVLPLLWLSVCARATANINFIYYCCECNTENLCEIFQCLFLAIFFVFFYELFQSLHETNINQVKLCK